MNELFVYDNFNRVPVDEVESGDICALTGISDIMVSQHAMLYAAHAVVGLRMHPPLWVSWSNAQAVGGGCSRLLAHARAGRSSRRRGRCR